MTSIEAASGEQQESTAKVQAGDSPLTLQILAGERHRYKVDIEGRVAHE